MRASNKSLPWIGLLAVLAAVALLRTKLLSLPLERDEGGYAYFGQLVLDGIVPFAAAYDTKLPGIYYIYAGIIWLFGSSPSGIHTGLLVANLVTMVSVFALGRRMGGDKVGLFSSLAYGVLSLSPWVQGLWAHLEHFLVAAVAIGLLLLLEAQARGSRKHAFLAGLFFGVALLIKQPALAFAGFGACCLVLGLPERRRSGSPPVRAMLLLLLLGASLPSLLEAAHLFGAGVWEKFRLWTFDYPARHISSNSIDVGIALLKKRAGRILSPQLVLACFALLGFLPPLWRRSWARTAGFLWLFFLFSLIALSPGLFFRPHYFLLMIPAVSLLAGFGFALIVEGLGLFLAGWWKRAAVVILVAAAIVTPFYRDAAFFFRMSNFEASRAVYQSNPFPESLVIANFIREKTTPDDRIAILGSEPQIYVYAERRSVTPYIFTYALMEDHPWALDMQQEMIRDIEEGKPAYLVSVNMASSWLPHPTSHGLLFKWAASYLPAHYEQVGLVQVPVRGAPVFLWGTTAERLVVRTPGGLGFRRPSISILRRRGFNRGVSGGGPDLD